jgi:hypothetical protein
MFDSGFRFTEKGRNVNEQREQRGERSLHVLHAALAFPLAPHDFSCF